MYAVTDKELYINLFISNDANITHWERERSIFPKKQISRGMGRLKYLLTLKNGKFDLKIRIPGWAHNEAVPGGLYKFTDQNNEPVKLMLNGKELKVNMIDGYAVISRKWKSGDKVEVDFPHACP